jgi:hypothetical protein
VTFGRDSANDRKPAVGSLIEQSRIQVPKRLEPRGPAAGRDWRTFPVIFTLDGGGSDFVPDLIGADFRVRTPCTLSAITFWEAFDNAASIEFDIWKAKWTDPAPTVADTILPAPIIIAGSARYEDILLANVNRNFVVGDVVKVMVTSCSDILRGFIELTLERSI